MTEFERSKLALVGGRIRKVRESSGLNLHELARLSGISAPALSLIETGKRDLRITSLYRIADALRTQARDLLGEPPAEPLKPERPDVQGYDLTDYT
ncbi:helix-turn-helix transcriptional regulator [Caulobacter segnis]|uniref:helix-turn-helix domain-containing protein n=1 Tax=Caulobacter segnis TaxID=88688 RepID=UPI00240F3E52|nr:helix-turn-helix transcriptional regulator [Caulobacter segnis]MDG2520413.1 helix-turn-helix transcriptional regulator [Caulobacter segnis]